MHEKDENGEWVDIDNSLALEDNRIENQSAANRVSFAPKAANAGRIAKLEKSGHALEWSLSSTIVKPTAQKAAADFVGPLPAFRAEQTALNAEAEAVIEPEEAAAGEANNGFMLCYESESLSNPDFNAFYTSNSAVAYRPSGCC